MLPECTHQGVPAAISGLALCLLFIGCDQGGIPASIPSRAKLPTVSIADGSPRAIVGRAIEAYGGAQNIQRLQTGRVEMVGRGAFAAGISGQFTVVDTFDLPRRPRREARFSDGKIELTMLSVIDGKHGWTKGTGEGSGDGTVRELQVDPDQNNAFPHSVLGSLLELRDPRVTLNKMPSDQPGFSWISIEHSGQSFGTNVFEDRSHRIVGSIKQLLDANGAVVTVRTVYSDYRRTAGIDVPMQMTSYQDGKPLLELKVIKLELLKSVDQRLFARPQ